MTEADDTHAAPGEGWDCHVHVFDAARAVAAGHYPPQHAPLSAIEAVAQAHGVGHLVLVQPSVYGHDNGLLLEALSHQPGRHRGVVVLGESVTDAELDRWHDLGVRGVRFNLVSPVGEREPPAERLARLAPRLRERGWHVQWYARPADWPAIAALHARCELVAVVDHLAGLGADAMADHLAAHPASHPIWCALQALAAQGAWIKLSGWYRLGAAAPYTALDETVRRVQALFGDRCVWGSDWPHTAFDAAARPGYASLWAPVVRSLGETAAHRLRARTPSIYR